PSPAAMKTPLSTGQRSFLFLMAGGAPADALLRRMEHFGSRLDFLRPLDPPPAAGEHRAAPRLGRSAPSLHGGKILLDKSAFDMVFCVCSVGKAPVGIWTVAAK